METIIRNEELTKVADSIKPDAKRRVYLPKLVIKEGISYHMYVNKTGQIILDPQVTISASEAWLFNNKAALDSVDKGMIESNQGKTKDRGSFSKFTKDES
jgi:hypothetical protein